jgi:nicotinate phosphoribosyltransferase
MNPLLTDFYQITMSLSYFKGNRHLEPAVFEAFFRKYPFKGGKYVIFAGLDEVIEFVKCFKFKPSHIAYLRSVLPTADEEYFKWLESVDTKDIKIYAPKDGTLVFAREPVIRVEGPIAIC